MVDVASHHRHDWPLVPSVVDAQIVSSATSEGCPLATSTVQANWESQSFVLIAKSPSVLSAEATALDTAMKRLIMVMGKIFMMPLILLCRKV